MTILSVVQHTNAHVFYLSLSCSFSLTLYLLLTFSYVFFVQCIYIYCFYFSSFYIYISFAFYYQLIKFVKLKIDGFWVGFCFLFSSFCCGCLFKKCVFFSLVAAISVILGQMKFLNMYFIDRIMMNVFRFIAFISIYSHSLSIRMHRLFRVNM